MKFRVEVICLDEDGVEQRSEVLEMERRQLAMETLGLSLADGKAILQGVQDFVTAQQVSEDLRRRRKCPNCGERYHRQEAGTHIVNSVLGPVPVPNPPPLSRTGSRRPTWSPGTAFPGWSDPLTKPPWGGRSWGRQSGKSIGASCLE